MNLLIGNDYQGPSAYYFGHGLGGFEEVGRSNKRFPYYVSSAMSIDSAHIDNNLSAEIYIAQISNYDLSDERELSDRPFETLCEDAQENTWKERCLANMRLHRVMQISTWRANFDPLVCNDLPSDIDRLDCVALKLYRKARRERNPEVCVYLPDHWIDIKRVCELVGERSVSNNQQLMLRAPRRFGDNKNFFLPHKKTGFLPIAPKH